MHITKISDQVWMWEDFLKEPGSVLQYFLDNWEWVPFYNQSNQLRGTQVYISKDDKFPHSEIIKLKLIKCFTEYLKAQGKDINDYSLYGNLVNIISFTPDWETGPHTDFAFEDAKYGGEPRAIPYTMILYYNDNYTGGELCFPEHGFKEKVKPGNLVIFDQNTVHDAMKLISGPRYISMIPIMERDILA